MTGVSRKWIVDLEGGGKRTADVSLVLRTLNALDLDVDIRERPSSAAPGEHDLNRIIERAKERPR